MSEPIYSVVAPVYNEEANLETLYSRLVPVLEALDGEYEVVLVDDGSRDRTLEILREFHQRNPRFKVISFSRNFGHQTAISAGIAHTTGKVIMVIDADLQDPPEVLPQFLDKWREGYDVVYAVRQKRKESAFKRFAYAAFYRILKYVSDVDIPLDSGDFGVMDRKVVDVISKQMPESNRFVRGMRSWVGFKQIGVAYERDKRLAGEPKYTLKKLMKLAIDGLISFSKLPLKLAAILGFFVSVLSFIAGFATLLQKLFTQTTVPGYTTTIILISFLGGVQLITIGIIGEYLGRIYDEVKHRPLYIVKETLGLPQNKQ